MTLAAGFHKALECLDEGNVSGHRTRYNGFSLSTKPRGGLLLCRIKFRGAMGSFATTHLSPSPLMAMALAAMNLGETGQT